VLRVGIGGLPLQTPERGTQQFIALISQEGLLRPDPSGQLEPWLAERSEVSDDGRTLTIRLRPNVVFHDGSPVNAHVVVDVLKAGLPRTMRSAFDDVESIEAIGDRDVVVHFRQWSNFLAESLVDVPIQKPSNTSIGTGPFSASPTVAGQSSIEMKANARYYQGEPTISRIVVNTYPNTRAAWAEMLRERLDMLYEVDTDAIDSMKDSKSASLYTFDRPYQYVVVLNTRSPKLADAGFRRALNAAIDRPTLVREGLKDQGRPSVGLVSEQHWTFQKEFATFAFDPRAAAAGVSKSRKAGESGPVRLKCLTLPGTQYERLSLVVKRQLEQVGVSLDVEEAAPEQIAAAIGRHDFETALIDTLSGPNLFRPYRSWIQAAGFSHPEVVTAFDKVRHAFGKEAYRKAVGDLQHAIAEDPPAIFLAWGNRSRAVTNRFDVQPEANRDIILTLRLWHLRADNRNATRN
jgi:peptide/nickel transport system substrate-binding protein